MIMYSDRNYPTANWPTLVRHPSYYPVRRLSLLWFLAFATIALGLCVIALIIVFAVESAWFQDSFNGTLRYGLWRVCVNSSACDSWFTTGSDSVSQIIQRRLELHRAGIHAWQALEIIFLVLTTATLIILIFSLIFYRYRRSIHYYLIFLGAFCIWPAVCIGIALLFVFGFAVFNVAPGRRDLEWCFYLNLVAVVLSLIAAVLLSIYDALFKRPVGRAINDDDDAVIERFPDLNGYPDGLNPSTYVIVRRNRKKRNKPYEYPTVLYPSTAPTPASVPNGKIPQTPQAPLTSYTPIVTTQETTTTAAPIQPPMTSASTRHVFTNNRSDLVPSTSLATFEPPITSYRTPVPLSAYPSNYSSPSLPPAPPVWNPNGITTVTRSYAYPSEPMNSAYPRSNYYPPRMPVAESRSEPRVLHYYTGYDYFATIDPSDAILTRNPPPLTRPGTAVRYNNNLTYYPTNDYVKSTM